MDELMAEAPYSTEYVKAQGEKFFAKLDKIIDSGDNFKEQDVKQGDTFVRICADNDRGLSPFFTRLRNVFSVNSPNLCRQPFR